MAAHDLGSRGQPGAGPAPPAAGPPRPVRGHARGPDLQRLETLEARWLSQRSASGCPLARPPGPSASVVACLTFAPAALGKSGGLPRGFGCKSWEVECYISAGGSAGEDPPNPAQPRSTSRNSAKHILMLGLILVGSSHMLLNGPLRSYEDRPGVAA
ncbi:unnamed protein product [Prorocentrum cordatum]|uniref:Mannosyltransferase n=1 Tax=Prorocentrum cordatum TaxID=2364126 RepID=A0ABN9QKW2_9DINO|nr:unnamed protein product [Polarella glacialis]